MTAGAEEHISKRIATLGESYIDIDMDAPAEPPTPGQANRYGNTVWNK